MKIVEQKPVIPMESPETPPQRVDNPELRKVARQFEAVFVEQMIGAMRKTVQPGGLIPESNAERTFKAMLDSENAGRIADAEQLGLSEIIYEHLLLSSQGR